MNRSTRNILRFVSILIVIALVLMKFGIIPDIFQYGFEFWVLMVAYAILLFTLRS